MGELVTVVIPVYRVEPYLRRCVDSVLAQTYRDMEVILVDDGSDDGCPSICDAYAASDERVRVIHQENRGLSGARNAGIETAAGEWLAFVDSDDYIAPGFLERLFEACSRTGSDVGICRWEYVHGREIPSNGGGQSDVYTGREALSRLYDPDGAYFVVAWNKLYRRELFSCIRYPLGRIHEDEATTYLIFDTAKKVVFLDESLYGYFVALKSITRGFNPKRVDWMAAQEERLDYFENKRYDELMLPALKAANDGCIDIYFEFADNMPDARAQKDEIRDFVGKSLKRVRAFGRFPFRTWIGYHMFLLCPEFYRKLLSKVKTGNGKQ